MKKNLLLTIFAFCFITLGFSQADCANALALTPGIQQAGDTTGNAGSMGNADTAANTCSGNYNDDEYWFEYTAVEDGETLELTASAIASNWYGLFVFDNCTDLAPTCVASAVNQGANTDLVVTTPALVAGTTYKIVMSDWAEGSTTFNMDSAVTPPPTCLEATNLSVAVLAGDVTATVSWDAEAGATLGYNWAVMTDGEDPAVDTPISMGSTGAGVTTDTATGLTAATNYDFYVQSNCDANGLSTWAGPLNFYSAAPPSNDECSNAIALTVNADYGCGMVTAGTNAAATESSEMETSGAVTGTPFTDVWYSFVATAVDHRISLTNVVAAIGTSTDMGFALYDATSGCGATLAAPFDDSDPNTLDATGFTIGTTYLLRIYGWSNTQTASAQTTFDICIGTPPSCLPPTGGFAGNITSTSADLNFTEGGTATTWNIEWGADAFVLGSGTTIADVTVNPQPLTGLTPSTAYDYYVQADCGGGDLSTWSGPYSFTTPAPPPANDDFANAEVMVCGNTYSEDTSLATLDEDDAPDGGSADLDAPNVWYSYTGTGAEEEVTLDLCTGSSYDTSVLVYTGTSGALTIIADNDDGAGCAGNTSLLTFVSDGTTTYYITVEGWNVNSTGVFNMVTSCVSAAPAPANDECANAEALTLGAATSGTTVGATGAVGDGNPTCESQFATIVDVWYTFVAPATSQVDITTTITGTSDQANVAVYDDCALTTQLGCSNANGGESFNVNGLTSGTTYYVRIWGDGIAARTSGGDRVNALRTEGTFDITIVESTLSTADFTSNTLFSYYPNPVKNTLTLNAQKEIANVSVFNMLGQTVLRSAPNAVSNELDMSNLQAGAYFVQVTVGNAVETVKVIKK